MSRRVSIGLQADGSIGVRVSLNGYDAWSDDADKMSFDSAWTDIAKINSVGIVNWSLAAFPSPGGGSIAGYAGSWPNNGYVPFAELRKLVGVSVVRDDYWSSAFPYGINHLLMADGFRTNEGTSTTDQVLFISYKIPVPSG